MLTHILLADDHQMVREGLKSLLSKQTDMRIVGEAADGQEAVRLAGELKPDVVVMDIGMPGMNGMDATRQIKAVHKTCRVIALSMHTDRHYIVGMLRSGASGFLLKSAAFEELAQAIKTVMADRDYLSPAVSRTVIEQCRQQVPHDEQSAFSILSDRERQVLQQIAEGHSTKEVAANLAIGSKTVETHRRRIMQKLGMHGVADLTKYAICEGLTSREPA
jgi:DNA-binding NarL/FixJ family response regulator